MGLKGNEFWKLRPRSGRRAIWESPDDLRNACEEYFQYVIDTPLEEDSVIAYQGKATHEPLKKMRTMSIEGLCVFLGISRRTWLNYKEKDDFIQVSEEVHSIMYDYKIAGASAGLLNQSIIARDLGLKDKTELTGEDGGPIKQQITFNPVSR